MGLREAKVGGKLSEEDYIFGAAAEGEVSSPARAEGDASFFSRGVNDQRLEWCC